MGPKLICIIFTSITIFSVVTYIVYRDRIINKLVPKLCNENESCVRFCCHNKVCDNDEKLRKREIKYSKNLDKNFKIIKGFPCEIVHTHKEWSFLKNGILVDKSNNTYDWTQYCYTFKNGPLTCPPIYETENVKDVYPWLMILSLPFLIITLFIYGFISELRTTHGKCIMSYVLSLILMYSSLIIIGLFNHKMLNYHNKICTISGYIFLTSVYMNFFWLNVMCYDTWKAIRSLTPIRDRSETFVKYFLYAFCIPAIISSIIISLNEFNLIPDDYKTGIGKYSCTISDPINDYSKEAKERISRAQKIYLYGPISFFLLMNLGFYLTTAYKIFKARRNAENFSTSTISRHTRKQKGRFSHYIRLFLMMGLPWIIEIISWIVEDNIVLYLVSIINCLQGFIIFFMFVLDKKVLLFIIKRKEKLMQNKLNQSTLPRIQNSKV